MAYLGSWKIDDLLYFYANTHRFDTGAATDADSVPTYRVYENETGTAILNGSMALLDSTNTAGFYSEELTLSAANGFEKGKQYVIYKTGTVNSVAGASHDTFQIEAEVDANSVSNIGANVITAASIATGAIDADAIADNAIDAGAIAADAITAAKIATGAIDADAIADGAIDAATFAAGAINNAAMSIDGSELTAIPWNASWDAEVQSEVQDALEVNNLDHLVKIAVDTNFATTVHLDSVIGHLADDGTTATFDRTTDSLEASQAEHDATQTKVDTVDDFLDTEIAAIKAKTDNLPTDPADASDIASSFSTVNTKLDTIDDFLDTEIAAVKAKTDQLTFTTANQVDANIQSVNDTALQGNGSSTPWGPV